MKNIFFLLLFVISCKSFPQSTCQTTIVTPLRTHGLPSKNCYYFKDTNNELQSFVGTWQGNWNNKTLLITFKKLINKYDDDLGYYKDFIIAKFETIDSNGTVLFSNTSVSDNNVKCEGIGFQNITDKYILSYTDKDICNMSGTIYITFANAAKTQMNFVFDERNKFLDTDCYYYNYPPSQYPEPLPKNDIVLTKQ